MFGNWDHFHNYLWLAKLLFANKGKDILEHDFCRISKIPRFISMQRRRGEKEKSFEFLQKMCTLEFRFF